MNLQEEKKLLYIYTHVKARVRVSVCARARIRDGEKEKDTQTHFKLNNKALLFFKNFFNMYVAINYYFQSQIIHVLEAHFLIEHNESYLPCWSIEIIRLF